MRRSSFLLLLCIASLAMPVVAYEPSTHKRLSEFAVTLSDLANASNMSSPPSKLRALGFARSVTDARLRFASTSGEDLTLMQLVQYGADLEDEIPRSIHHFFDPRTGQGLHLDPEPYADSGLRDLLHLVNGAAEPSPQWALTGQTAYWTNRFSYRLLRDYWFQSLTNLDALKRSQFTGLTFEGLGHLIHHLQDMAQPQHVRNDAHLQDDDKDEACLTDGDTTRLCAAYVAVRNESLIEKWAKRREAELPLGGYPSVYASATNDVRDFAQPIQFWASSGKGIAEFTNSNFVSDGTLSESPPVLDTSVETTLGALCASAMPLCPPGDPGTVVRFYASVVNDRLRPGDVVNDRAAAESILGADLRAMNPASPIQRSVNRFTFDRSFDFLMPRAVGYSAGMLNFFFRGTIETAVPDDGVYAVADTAPSACSGSCGFKKVKVKLRNATPGNEAMTDGAVWAVAKYFRNKCYRQDLSGDYGGPNFQGNTCRSLQESVSVSEGVLVAAMSTALTSFEFDFSRAPIPFDASDVYLQVVFRGTLGQEFDAVAVSTDDIAEPNYFAVANMTDYVYDNMGDNQYHPLPYKTYTSDTLLYKVQLWIGNSATPIATIPEVRGGQHGQVAILGPISDIPIRLHYNNWSELAGYLHTSEFKASDAAGLYSRSCPVHRARGVYRQLLYYLSQDVATSVTGGIHGLSTAGGAAPGASASAAGARAGSGGLAEKVTYNCVVDDSGFGDFSAMAPHDMNTALRWSLSF